MGPKKKDIVVSPKKQMPRIRAFRKFAAAYRPEIEAPESSDEDEVGSQLPLEKTASSSPPAKRSKRAKKAAEKPVKAAEKSVKAAEKPVKAAEKPVKAAEKPVKKAAEPKQVLAKNKKPATTKKPAPKKKGVSLPPPPETDESDIEGESDDDDEHEPGPEDEPDYMLEDGDPIEEEENEPDDAVTAILQEEAQEPPIKKGRKKRSPNINLTPKQQSDIIEFVKSHPNLYDRSDPQFFLTPVRDKTWEDGSAELGIPGN